MSTTRDLGVPLVEKLKGLPKLRCYCGMAKAYHAAYDLDKMRDALARAAEAVAAMGADAGSYEHCRLAAALLEVGDNGGAQRALDAAARSAREAAGVDKVYAWCHLADVLVSNQRAQDAMPALDQAAEAASTLADSDKYSALVDVAEQFVRAGCRERAGDIAASIDAAARRMTGRDRACTLGLLADLQLDLGNTMAAQEAVDAAVAGAGSCEPLERVIVVCDAVDTYLRMGAPDRARDVLSFAQTSLRASEDAGNEIALLCVARGYAALGDLAAAREVAGCTEALGRVRILSSIATVFHGRHKDTAAALGLLCAAFDAAEKVEGRRRLYALDRLVPLCIELDGAELTGEQHARLSAIAARLAAP